ncbi:MAG: CotH kinase family protein, partial [Akkermansiaceae bacterium]
AIPGNPSHTFTVSPYPSGHSLISWRGSDNLPYQLYTTETYFGPNDPPLFATEVVDPNGDYGLLLHQASAPLPPNSASLTLAALPQVEQDQVTLLTVARQQIIAELAANVGNNSQNATASSDLGNAGFFRLIIRRDDIDGDGLYDDLETSFGLNPYDPDTDQDGVTDPWDYASINHLIITEFMASNDAVIADEDGDFEDYIEIFNPTSSPLDLAGHYLACNENSPLRWQFPSPAGGIPIQPGESIVVFASGKDRKPFGGPYHTDFGLSASNGEDLLLSNSNGVVLDSHLDWGRQRLNASAGWGLDQETGLVSALRYFLDPTPRMVNSPSSCTGLSDAPDFNVNGGVYSGGVQSVTVSTMDPADTIHYTLDNSNPTTDSPIYSGQPLQIDETTIVRAMAIKPGCIASPITARSFLYTTNVIGTGGQGNPAVGFQERPADYPESSIVNGARVGPLDYAMDPQVIQDNYDALAQELTAIPSLSVTLPVGQLFGATDGFYSRSEDTNVSSRDPLGNEWRRLASIEYIDPANPSNYKQENGEITISGASSRRFSTTDKHNMRLLFKSKFSRAGSATMNFNLFDPPFSTTGTYQFRQMTLRQPTHDSWALKWSFPQRERAVHSREAWAREMHRRMNPVDNIIANRRWVHLYLNGIHWGIYELGERVDQNFARTYGDEFGEYDVLKQSLEIVEGDRIAYNNMINACTSAANSPGNAALWQAVTDVLDVDTYIDYLIVNMFMQNRDWITGNNWRTLRRRTDPNDPNDIARFKFIVWDAEYAMDPNNTSEDYTDGRYLHLSPRGALVAHARLIDHPDYQAAWQARVHQHFHTPGGCYYAIGNNHEASIIFDAEALLFGAVVTTESARWGDANRNTAYSPAEWLTAKNAHRDSYIKMRRDEFLGRLVDKDLAIEVP